MKNLKIKIITGFRKEQSYTIDANEAHKAYYLFLNPDKRGVFKNGVALIGQDIRGIEPDYHATMGWNPTYILGSDDWNELRDKGIDSALQKVVASAKDAAQLLPPEKMNLPLSSLLPELTPQALPEAKGLAAKFKV
jgi:hypothetical protein